MRGKALVGAAALVLLAGCDSGFDPPSQVDGLRVLIVKPEPASGTPGQSSLLTMVTADGTRAEDGSLRRPRPLQIAWFGACHNPPSRQYYACFPVLNAIAQRLSSRVIETPLSGVPKGIFGLGPNFELTLPDDILSSAPKTSADPVHYGVSYAFFAACAGELRARPDLQDRVPLDCIDPETGEALGHRDFVTGFTTLFSYEDDVPVNQSPALTTLSFAGSELPEPTVGCLEDADCADFAVENSFDAGCERESGRCLPRFDPCPAKGDCPSLSVLPDLDRSSAEPLPGQNAKEVVWLSFYATAGSFDPSTELVNDRSTGWIEDHAAYYSPPRRAIGRVELWVTANDQRGGADFRKFEILVRDHD
jgi:hypothetical protein